MILTLETQKAEGERIDSLEWEVNMAGNAQEFQLWVDGLKDATEKQFQEVEDKIAHLIVDNNFLMNILTPLVDLKKATLDGQGVTGVLISKADVDTLKKEVFDYTKELWHRATGLFQDHMAKPIDKNKAWFEVAGEYKVREENAELRARNTDLEMQLEAIQKQLKAHQTKVQLRAQDSMQMAEVEDLQRQEKHEDSKGLSTQNDSQAVDVHDYLRDFCISDTQGELCKDLVQEQNISNMDTPKFEDLDEQRYVPEDLYADVLEGVQAPTLPRQEDFGNSYLEGLTNDVHLSNALTNCMCYDDSMDYEIDAIFALQADFHEGEVQRYLQMPIQIDEQKPIQIDKEKLIQINKQKPIQGVFHEVYFAHSTKIGQEVSAAIEERQLMDLLDDALEGFLSSSIIYSSQHNEVCDLKPCTDEEDIELMQMLDEVIDDFRPSLCHDDIPREVMNALEPTEKNDAMDYFDLLIFLEDMVSSNEGVYFSMMENLELLPYDPKGVAGSLQVYESVLLFDLGGSTYFFPEGSYNFNDLHLNIFQSYDPRGCFEIPMQSYFIFMAWDPRGGYTRDFIRHYIYMFLAVNALLLHCYLSFTISKFLYYSYDLGGY
ncbi:hypothetical protein L7F22_046318 [Adiantum nelumboides]|nr:hypothetical protein [Adiantum nelumboides]